MKDPQQRKPVKKKFLLMRRKKKSGTIIGSSQSKKINEITFLKGHPGREIYGLSGKGSVRGCEDSH